MIDLDAIKARLAAIPAFGSIMPAEFSEELYCRMAVIHAPEPDEYRQLVCVPADEYVESPPLFDFIANAPTDIAALIAEVERLRDELNNAQQAHR